MQIKNILNYRANDTRLWIFEDFSIQAVSTVEIWLSKYVRKYIFKHSLLP